MWRVHRVCTLQSSVSWPTHALSCCGLPPCVFIWADKNAACIPLLPREQHPLPAPLPSSCHLKWATGAAIRTGLGEGEGQKGRQKEGGKQSKPGLKRTSTTLLWQGKEGGRVWRQEEFFGSADSICTTSCKYFMDRISQRHGTESLRKITTINVLRFFFFSFFIKNYRNQQRPLIAWFFL